MKPSLAEQLSEVAATCAAIAEATSASGDAKLTLAALAQQLNALLAVARLSPEQAGYESMTTAQRVQYVKRDTDTYRGLLDDIIREFRGTDRGQLSDSPSQPIDSKPV